MRTIPTWSGVAVLGAAIAHAADCGPGLVWGNATPAGARLFASAGFEQIGEPWVDPEFGSNVRMWREI